MTSSDTPTQQVPERDQDERSTPEARCPQCGGGIVGPDPVFEGRTLTWRNVGASRESFTDRSCSYKWHDEIEDRSLISTLKDPK